MSEGPTSIDAIEEMDSPHDGNHAPQDPQDMSDGPLSPRRVKITLADLKKVGVSPCCPKCNLYEIGQTQQAQASNHTEACRRCAYDLRIQTGENAGELIYKPWTIATNSQTFMQTLPLETANVQRSMGR